MSSLFNALSSLFEPSLADVQERHDRYLSEAVDMCDLERRMHLLDSPQRSPFEPAPHGIFTG